MKILICCDNARRDLLPNKLIAKKLENFGHKVVLCNGRTLRILFRIIRPEITILPRGDLPIAKSIGEVSKLIIVPAEGARLTKETMLSVFVGRTHKFNKDNHRLDQNNEVIKNFDHIHKLYLWGKISYEFLIESGFFKKEQLKITGNPRLDVYKKNNLKINYKTNTIGIAITIKNVSTYLGKFNYLESLSRLSEHEANHHLPLVPKNRSWEDYAWRDFAVARLTMETIDCIIRKSNFKIRIRINPFENFNDYLFLEKKYGDRIILDHPECLLNEFLNEIDLLITCWSTTGVESLISNVPVISLIGLLDQEHLFSHIDPVANGFNNFLPLYYKPTSFTKLLELLNLLKEDKLDLTQEPELYNQLVNEIYNWPSPEKASDIIVEDINQTTINVIEKPKIDGILLFNKNIEKIIQTNFLIEKILIYSIYSLKILMNFFDDYINNFWNHYRYFYKLKNHRVDSIIRESEEN